VQSYDENICDKLTLTKVHPVRLPIGSRSNFCLKWRVVRPPVRGVTLAAGDKFILLIVLALQPQSWYSAQILSMLIAYSLGFRSL
jgi:hypothetical protein